MENLLGKKVFITGSAYRLGKVTALAAARNGADIILHYGHSPDEADQTAEEIRALGRNCWVYQADLQNTHDVDKLISDSSTHSPIYCLVNSASIFPPGEMLETDIATWQQCLSVNLTAPFLLSQAFIRSHKSTEPGRIINILDWRALRPGIDHFAYTISKSGLAALTLASARAGAPNITVNALALGAILPPSNEPPDDKLTAQIPLKRWATLDEFEEAIMFLIKGPAFINGEIIHLDGGRHIL
jgi:NAD(P)-dependent dehydrogenase (short-subunit alcohol dehydrogenase family)